MKKKVSKIILVGILVITFVLGIITYSNMKPVSKEQDIVTFTIKPGTNKIEIVKNLKKANVIKSDILMLAYVFISPNKNLQAGTYYVDRSDKPTEIINQIAKGDTREVAKTISVKFVEGNWFTYYAKTISDNFDYTYDEVIKVGTNEDFIRTLIDEYWFLDDSILNKKIYYPLEGYLFPDTYEFYESATIEDIFRKMLNEFGKKIEPLKDKVSKSKYNLHEILTIASIAEKEALPKRESMKDQGIKAYDREIVSQVVHKRLDIGMTLGMDVTTYYGVQKPMSEYLTSKDLNDYNGYNTRHPKFTGLPVGPICNPSLESIEAALNPSDTAYTYFVADVNTGQVYFASTYDEFYQYCIQLGLR